MQVQRLQSPLFHAHAHPAPVEQNHSNGVHSDSRNQHLPSTNGHTTNDEMDPSQYPYGGGYGAPQQQRQQQPQQQNPPNQLPPMYANTSMPPMIANTSIPPMPPPPRRIFPPPPNFPNYSPGPQPSLQSRGLPPPPPLPQKGHSNQVVDKPMLHSGDNGKYRFTLLVEQQPQRARMCGFGDKDRRPITPPPCVRLIITDLVTNEPVSTDQVEGTFFVLQVDLWDDSASHEVNIVRSSSSSPAVSISTATTTSYPPPADPHMIDAGYHQQPALGPDGRPMYPGFHAQMGPASVSNWPPNIGYFPPPPVSFPGQPTYLPGPGPQPTHSMFTRNLIGSLTVNASMLKDTEDKLGFWFVLQDLSVRTEGWFR